MFTFKKKVKISKSSIFILTAMTDTKNKKRKQPTVDEKAGILKRIKDGASHRDIVKEVCVSKRVVSGVIKGKDKIEKASTARTKTRHRSRFGSYWPCFCMGYKWHKMGARGVQKYEILPKYFP